MQRNSSAKFNIPDNDLRLVNISVPHNDHGVYSTRDAETWLSLLEQSLACNFNDYQLIINEDNYAQAMTVSILFASIDDATLFKLQRKD